MKTLFRESHPAIYSQIHATKNVAADFSKLYTNSSKKVWWQCPVNQKHEWLQSINVRTKKNGYNCPYCSGRKTLREESFGSLYPQIAAELHPSKNKSFDPFIYSVNSNKKVWWLCSKGHECHEEVKLRVKRKICPECKKISKSIAYTHPEVVKEWHPTKNLPLTPEDVNSNNNTRVWWQCQKDPTHIWRVTVRTKISHNSKCRKCENKKNKHRAPQTLSAKNFPDLLSQWHPTRNPNLKPENFLLGSSQKIWWQCPKKKEHVWESTINNRTHGKGCPDCAKTNVTEENSLLFRFPILAQQWHPTKNEMPPSKISYGSHKKVWWQCEKDNDHSWLKAVNEVTRRNKLKCPICNSLKYVHPDIAAEWHPDKNDNLKPEDVTRASGKKVWWQCPTNPSHNWPAIVKNRTVLKSGCPHCSEEKNILRLSVHLHDLVHSDIDYYHVFLGNIRIVNKLLDVSLADQPRLSQPMYNMLYTSTITAMETYLSDAFCHNVLNDNELIEKFITGNPDFCKKNYSLSEVINWQQNIQKNVINYLLDIIWHNLSRVKNMYKDVLEIDFPADIKSIYQAIAIRHDIVHRNGKTKSGKSNIVSKDDLKNLLIDIERFINDINYKLKNRKS